MKVLRYRLHREAERELLGAALYYQDRDPNIGRNLLRTFRAAMDQIVRFPVSCAIFDVAVRQKPLGKFPFSILYQIREGQIFVVAFMHQSRKPGYWAGRTN